MNPLTEIRVVTDRATGQKFIINKVSGLLVGLVTSEGVIVNVGGSYTTAELDRQLTLLELGTNE